MAVAKEALDLIKEFEGYLKRIPGTDRVRPYLCPAGVPTIGWGTTFYPDGRKVTMSDPDISPIRATECLAYELRGNERDVDALTPGAQWNELMRGAIISFVYNVGNGAYRASTLRKKIIAGQWQDVPRELAKWNKGGGRVLPGLTRRRTAEAAMFMRGLKLMQEGASKPASEAELTINRPVARPESWVAKWTRRLFGK